MSRDDVWDMSKDDVWDMSRDDVWDMSKDDVWDMSRDDVWDMRRVSYLYLPYGGGGNLSYDLYLYLNLKFCTL
jgi:hypothetical protein